MNQKLIDTQLSTKYILVSDTGYYIDNDLFYQPYFFNNYENALSFDSQQEAEDFLNSPDKDYSLLNLKIKKVTEC